MPPDSKTLCNMGTYLGFILTFSMLTILIPPLAFVFISVKWMVTATYLHLMPFGAWVKTRLVVEALNIGVYYNLWVRIISYPMVPHAWAPIAIIFTFIAAYMIITVYYVYLERVGFFRRIIV